jgi:uncharacterized protein (DUF2126 family)
LNLPERYLVPAYEDVYYFLWEEGRLPANVDPLKANLKDPVERRRLAQLLERGLDQPSGYVLPLRWNYGKQTWESSTWDFRRGHLALVPGDSPMGLRLPLNSLPWVAEEEQEPFIERSPFDHYPPLDDYYQTAQKRSLAAAAAATATETQTQPAPQKMTEAREVARTGLCLEPRDGRLYLFMPPLSYLEHYLDLLAAIELTAEELSLPVVLEG